MRIESLKEQARRHEQNDEWRQALEQYKKAITLLEQDDQPDIGLYNRVGDLFVRVANFEEAVENYEKAVDLYVDAGLHNNAIAVCKKIVRSAAHRHQVYLRMGRIRAQQGFIPDARENFLIYAERMQKGGDLDESFRALVELCDLAPGETEFRLAVAEQMVGYDRTQEAIGQLSVAYAVLLERGEEDKAAEVAARAREVDAEADLSVLAAVVGGVSRETAEGGFEVGAVFGGEGHAEVPPPPLEGLESTALHAGGSDGGVEPGGEESEVRAGASSGEPTDVPGSQEEVGAGDEAAYEFESPPDDLPYVHVYHDDDEEPAKGLVDLPEAWVESTAEVGADGSGHPGDVGGASAETADGSERPEEVWDIADLRERIAQDPANVGLRQRLVELAYVAGDSTDLVEAYMGLAAALTRAGDDVRARAAYQEVLHLDEHHVGARMALGDESPAAPAGAGEVASNEDYVDLGALVLSEEDTTTTRFVVPYEEPSGDEEADFARMLTQFKQKVSQNLDAGDVRAHYDLGTAYKEMGLLDEAVAEFQQALRGSDSHLPTYEMLGQTFIEMENPAAAVRSLERALEVEHAVEDELLAIYYYLARAYEQVGNKGQAVEFYDRVFSLDINFADVTERLRALR